jgi:hypothetical protein
MYQLYYSHNSMIHLALEFVFVSRLFLRIVVSPMVGDNSPILAFQSPHMVELVHSGIPPNMSSIKLRAISSFVPRFYIFCTGGK